MSAQSSRWLQISIVGLAAVIGVIFYTNMQPIADNGDALGLQRIDLLYLKEPAPEIDDLGLTGSKAVLVFCADCSLPVVDGAKVIRIVDKRIATEYVLVTNSGEVGPGYALVDTLGQVRYRTFDPQLSQHASEINRLVRGIE